MNNQAAARPLSTIAGEIEVNWKNLSPHAAPYLQAMGHLNSMDDRYYLDDAKSVVLYFLANASSWRGDTARRVKAELKAMAGAK